MLRLDPEGKEVPPFPFTVSAMLSGPSEEEATPGEVLWPGCRHNTGSNVVVLTADNEVHRLAGAVTDRIRRMTPEGSLVVAGHPDDDEGGSFVSGVNSVTGCDLGAAVEPDVGERGAGRDGTPQDSRTLGFGQGALVHA